ncbi:MAG TPA: ABC transporter permease [Vicinamibacterales bacterium]|nr:ABC transporter permease [Vicinamibacterales bacterium]
MDSLTRLASRVRACLSSARLDRDFDQELESHLQMVEEDHVRRGMTPDDARRAARLELGGLPQLREAHRDVRGLPLVEQFLADLRYGLRGIRGSPGFGAVAILTLAIGIGANSAMFSVVYGVLLQPLGYPDPDRLVFVARGESQNAQQWLSLPRVEATRKSIRSLTDLGAYLARRNEDVTFSGRGEPEVLRGARVSANFLEILGVRPKRGRSFLSTEDAPGGPPVAMISAALWKRRFGAAVSIDGQMATLDSVPHAIIGVLPEGFRFPFPDVDVWLTQPSQTPSLAPQYRACCVALFGFGRLKPGVSLEQARAELDVLSAQYEAARPKALDRGPLRVAPYKDELTTDVSQMLWMLLAAVGFVLLIACANVATLLMARATSRERELAVRTALGAPRGRLVRQLLTESLVLSAAGGALGLLVASITVGLFTGSWIFDLPRADEVHLSGIVLAFTTAVSVAAGLVFGMLPALQIMRPGVVESLRQSGATSADGRGKSGRLRMNTRAALVAVQVALSVVLLVGAALMLKSLAQLAAVDTGFRSEGLLTMRIPLPAARYASPEKKAAVFESIAREVGAVPGIRAMAMARALPTTNTFGTNIQIVGQEIPAPGHLGTVLQSVTPGFFQGDPVTALRPS